MIHFLGKYMKSRLFKIRQFFSTNFKKIRNQKLESHVISYEFLVICNQNDFDENIDFFSNIGKSEFIIVNHCEEKNGKKNIGYFFIGFKKTIIIIDQQLLSKLNQFFKNNSNIKICFIPNTKNIFDKSVIRGCVLGCISFNRYTASSFRLKCHIFPSLYYWDQFDS